MHTLNVACWNKEEELKLYLPASFRTTGDASVKNKVSNHFIKVKAEKLDDILKTVEMGSVKLIKIDAEGAEGEIIEGAEETIVKRKPLKIIFEAKDSEQFAKCEQILKRYGMKIKQIDSHNFLAEKR